MSWTRDEQRAVANALLGSWPGTMTQWGKEAFAAYVAELQARGLAAEGVLVAIRTWPAGSDFPPSAPNLAAAARKDHGQPTFDEAMTLIFGRGGVLAARTRHKVPPEPGRTYWKPGEREDLDDEARLERANTVHPLVAKFIRDHGGMRRMLRWQDEVLDPEYGALRRKEIREAWERFCDVNDGREIVALVSGRGRGELGHLDPLAALVASRPELGAGE